MLRTGRPKYPDINLSQCHVLHHQPLVERPGKGPDLWSERLVTNRPIYGTIHLIFLDMTVLILFGAKYEVWNSNKLTNQMQQFYKFIT
jgi:hypothetical protein